jgi:hypothetical protein
VLFNVLHNPEGTPIEGALTLPPPPPLLGINREILEGWLVQNIPLHLAWCNNFVPLGGLSREQVLQAWVRWALNLDLIGIFTNVRKEQCTVGYILARPARFDTILVLQNDPKAYFDSLFTFEPDGDCIWIDTIWAPGQYRIVLDWLNARGTTHRNKVAWEHKGRLYVYPISNLSGETPMRSQIKAALIDVDSIAGR